MTKLTDDLRNHFQNNFIAKGIRKFANARRPNATNAMTLKEVIRNFKKQQQPKQIAAMVQQPKQLAAMVQQPRKLAAMRSCSCKRKRKHKW
jgi:hypothetical protein